MSTFTPTAEEGEASMLTPTFSTEMSPAWTEEQEEEDKISEVGLLP